MPCRLPMHKPCCHAPSVCAYTHNTIASCNSCGVSWAMLLSMQVLMGSYIHFPSAERCARVHCMCIWAAGEYARFQPRTAEFQQAVGADVRGALEAALARHSTLTQGNWIRVSFGGQDFELLVQKTRPGKAVSVIGLCTILDTKLIHAVTMMLAGKDALHHMY